MTEAESISYLKKTLNIRARNTDLLLLESMKAMLLRADDEDRKKIGLLVVSFARLHKLKDWQLLKFFDVTMSAAKSAAGEEFLQEHGLYRTLVASRNLSSTCALFFDAWWAASYEENPMKCTIRRIGIDAFRIVSILPNGTEFEHDEDVTMDQAAAYTNCPMDDLQAMLVLQ